MNRSRKKFSIGAGRTDTDKPALKKSANTPDDPEALKAFLGTATVQQHPTENIAPPFEEIPAPKRGRPKTTRVTQPMSLRLTPDDTQILGKIAAQAVADGYSPVKLSNTLIMRAAIRIMGDSNADRVCRALEAAQND